MTRGTEGLWIGLLLASAILIDSWVFDDGQPLVPPEGRSSAGIPTPEVVECRAVGRRAVPVNRIPRARSGATPSKPAGFPIPAVELIDPPPRPACPASWLGPRHFRSPT